MTLAPPRETRRSFPPIVAGIGISILFLALAFITNSKVLLDPDVVFSFNDGNIEIALAPLMQAPETFFRLWNNQLFFGRGSGGAPVTGSTLLNSLLGPHEYRRTGVLLTIWFAGLAGYWTCRQFGRSRSASLVSGLIMMLCGWSFTFPTVGLPARTFTLAFSALSLGWMKRAFATSSALGFAVAGGFLGLAVSDTPDVGIMFSLCCAATFVALHCSGRNLKASLSTGALGRSALHFAIYAAISLLIAYQTIGHQVGSNIKGVTQGTSETPEKKYEWATQWSLPPVESWSLFASDYHGASSRSMESPYTGGMGRDAQWKTTHKGFRNFRLAGYAVGTVPLILLAFVLLGLNRHGPPDIRTNRVLVGSFFGLMILALVLSWGKHFPLYRLFYALPYMGTIRNPDKWLGPFTLFLCLLSAYGLDGFLCLLRAEDRKPLLSAIRRTSIVGAVIAAVGIIDLVRLHLSKPLIISSLKSQGYPEAETENAWNIAVHADTRLILLMIAGVGVAWIAYTFARRQSTAKAAWLIPAALGILIFVDLSAASKPFVIPHAYKHILDENSVTRYLNENTNRGRVKILPPQHPLMNNWRLGFLSAKGYDLFDPISISRMPQNYEAFFQAMGNDMLRLWSLGSVRYFVCLPDYAAQLKKMSRPGAEFVTRLKFGATQDVKGNVIPSNSVPDNQKVLELIEYTGAMPFHYFAQTWHIMDDSPEGDAATLSELASPQFDYRTSALIQGEGLSAGTGASGNISVTYRHPTRETLAVSLPAPGLLVRTTEYDARWEVTIDGEPAPLVRANALFQAVHVPEGKHIIMFAFKPSIEPLYISLTGRCLFLIAIGAALLFERKARIIEDKDYDSERT